MKEDGEKELKSRTLLQVKRRERRRRKMERIGKWRTDFGETERKRVGGGGANVTMEKSA